MGNVQTRKDLSQLRHIARLRRFAYTRAHAHMRACAHVHACACAYMHACTHTYTHAHLHASTDAGRDDSKATAKLLALAKRCMHARHLPTHMHAKTCACPPASTPTPYCTARHGTAPHRTAPHRPHRTAPHRTAPHRTCTHTRAHTRAYGQACADTPVPACTAHLN